MMAWRDTFQFTQTNNLGLGSSQTELTNVATSPCGSRLSIDVATVVG